MDSPSENRTQGVSTTTVRKFYLSNKANNTDNPSTRDLYPPRFNANRQYLAPKRHGKHPEYDTDESVGEPSRKFDANNNPFDDTDSSNESYQPSHTVSSHSSIAQTPVDTPDTGHLSINSYDFFKPKAPPEKKLLPPLSYKEPKVPGRVARRSDERDSSDSTSRAVSTGDLAALARRHQAQRDHEVEAAPTPATAIKQASEIQRATIQDQKRGKRNITIQKYMVTAGLVAVNTMFIFSSWWWSRYYYIYLPFICFPLVLNCIMIASIIFFKLRNNLRPEKTIEPDHVESLAMIMPCYNETLDECTKSLDSLVNQVGIDDNKRGIIVVCDGRVRGPGMEKTTADYLLEDIFVDRTHHEKIINAYKGWNGEQMDLEISRGFYKGVPYYCMVKEKNQGKRDSLIVVRSFLHKFNIRRTSPKHIFSPQLFNSLSTWLTQDCDVDFVDHLIGMDADTIFDTDCIFQLLKESRYPNTVGVCGYVAVDFSGGNWNIWSLYQNAEYTIAQGLRRLHQSIATKKVSCLPGCCQLLRVCEYTCGDKVLIDLFGYHPGPLDGMLKQIRATASEDRNHVCLMLTTFPKAQTRQALRARAFTDVPHSWPVYLSQRRRWTLGATSNDLLLFVARHCQWWERILAFSNVLCWCLNVFIVASIGCMIVAFMSQPVWIIMAFAGVMLIPLTYYIIIATWLPHTFKGRIQYLLGLFVFVVCGPFLNITVMVFAVFNMDSFGWGKTRLVVPDDVKDQMAGKPSGGATPLQSDSSNSVPLREKPERYDEEAMVGGTVGRPRTAQLSPVPRKPVP